MVVLWTRQFCLLLVAACSPSKRFRKSCNPPPCPAIGILAHRKCTEVANSFFGKTCIKFLGGKGGPEKEQNAV